MIAATSRLLPAVAATIGRGCRGAIFRLGVAKTEQRRTEDERPRCPRRGDAEALLRCQRKTLQTGSGLDVQARRHGSDLLQVADQDLVGNDRGREASSAISVRYRTEPHAARRSAAFPR